MGTATKAGSTQQLPRVCCTAHALGQGCTCPCTPTVSITITQHHFFAARGIYICRYPLILKSHKNPITDKALGMKVKEMVVLAGGLKYPHFILLPTHITNVSEHEKHSVKFNSLVSQKH